MNTSWPSWTTFNQGKTQVWNRGQAEPRDIEVLQAAAQVEDPDAIVWKGRPNLPTTKQGVVLLGTPLGHADFVQEHLRAKTESHRILLDRIPSVPDLQTTWLILLFCASMRANFLLRALPPDATRDFARRHDCSLRSCLSTLFEGRDPRGHMGHREFAAVSGRIGPRERTAHPSRGQLGELGRLPRNGAPTPPRSRSYHDSRTTRLRSWVPLGMGGQSSPGSG